MVIRSVEYPDNNIGGLNWGQRLNIRRLDHQHTNWFVYQTWDYEYSLQYIYIMARVINRDFGMGEGTRVRWVGGDLRVICDKIRRCHK